MSEGLQSAGRRREAPVVGITGNIGTGKSTVAKFLADLGVYVIDADHVVHALYRDPDSALVRAVAAAFGEDIRAEDGWLDRAALGKVVFNDAAALSKLEMLVHPAVVAEVQKALDRTPLHVPCAIEAIKLIESDLVMMLDTVWVVVATPALQRERLSARGMSPGAAQQRLDMQASVEEKVALLRQKRGASFPVSIVSNAGTLADLRATVHETWGALETMMRQMEES